MEQPRTMQERVALAASFREQLQLPEKIPVLVDTILNCFQDTYAAWPYRFYGLQDGRVNI